MTGDVEQFAVHIDACVQDFGGDARCWTLLVSGPEDALLSWSLDVFPEFFDRRGQTGRFRLWFGHDEDPLASLTRAIDAARRFDVTVQLLCVYEPIEDSAQHYHLETGASVTVREMREEYPICHLGSHGMRWGT